MGPNPETMLIALLEKNNNNKKKTLFSIKQQTHLDLLKF